MQATSYEGSLVTLPRQQPAAGHCFWPHVFVASLRCLFVTVYLATLRLQLLSWNFKHGAMPLGSRRYIRQVTAPCSGAQSEVSCAWQHLFYIYFTSVANKIRIHNVASSVKGEHLHLLIDSFCKRQAHKHSTGMNWGPTKDEASALTKRTSCRRSRVSSGFSWLIALFRVNLGPQPCHNLVFPVFDVVLCYCPAGVFYYMQYRLHGHEK